MKISPKRNIHSTIKNRLKELKQRCMRVAKDEHLQFFKNWHIGLCTDITNYDKDYRCTIKICGANCIRFTKSYNSYYEFVDETGYKGEWHGITDPLLVLFSYNNYHIEGDEISNEVEDVFFLDTKDIIQDIPYTKYSNIQHFDSKYLNILNSSKWSIFTLKDSYTKEISFVLYMPSFESDIQLIQTIYPGLTESGEIYFSDLESKLLEFTLEIEGIKSNIDTEKSTFLDLLSSDYLDKDDWFLTCSKLREYDNILPQIYSPKIFNPLRFKEILEEKEHEINKYVNTLDIIDIANNYTLSIEIWYKRVGGNRDGYDVANVSIEVSKDSRRDEYISKLLPPFVSTDKYLENNSEKYYSWSKKDEMDNYVSQIQNNIRNKFLECYSREQHISYLLYSFVYDAFNREQSGLKRSIEYTLKVLRLKSWISRYFIS